MKDQLDTHMRDLFAHLHPRELIAKAGRVVMQAAELQAQAVADGQLEWAARFADTQERWSAVAFDAASRLYYGEHPSYVAGVTA